MTPKEQAQFRILKAFDENPELTQRQLAQQLGLSLSKTHYLLDALIEKGAIKMEHFRRSDTKLKRIAYLLTPSGISERLRLTQDYVARKKTEYDALKAEIQALEHYSMRISAESERSEA
ncbi:MAG: MarR family EPS-associated transcriptional regulator [Rhodocyclaceae bacterium]|nr:MarR family EPS-associated transcriptional regulator [Rhodocyclaceae bacterium]